MKTEFKDDFGFYYVPIQEIKLNGQNVLHWEQRNVSDRLINNQMHLPTNFTKENIVDAFDGLGVDRIIESRKKR